MTIILKDKDYPDYDLTKRSIGEGLNMSEDDQELAFKRIHELRGKYFSLKGIKEIEEHLHEFSGRELAMIMAFYIDTLSTEILEKKLGVLMRNLHD